LALAPGLVTGISKGAVDPIVSLMIFPCHSRINRKAMVGPWPYTGRLSSDRELEAAGLSGLPVY
jgi:hypothetical protein